MRVDALNWQIRKNGKYPDGYPNFYGTLTEAFMGLELKMLHAEVKNDVQALLRSHKALHETITESLKHLPTAL